MAGEVGTGDTEGEGAADSGVSGLGPWLAFPNSRYAVSPLQT